MSLQANNPVESLAAAVYTALESSYILPDVPNDIGRGGQEVGTQLRRPRIGDLDIRHFPQLWGSTALGFGGMGGAAMSRAYTTVIIHQDVAAVFFSGRHAYTVEMFNKKLLEDVSKGCMASVNECNKYIDTENPKP